MRYSKLLLTLFFTPFAIQSANSTNHAALNKRLFTHIYEHNSWGSGESRSGEGSSLRRTETVRSQLPKLIKQWDIKTILDAPCGDFNWMNAMDLSNIKRYIGFDIVAPLIQQNRERYGAPDRRFSVVDIVNDPLPCVDLIICRDCVQHLTDQDVFKLFANVKRSGSRYLLVSNYPKSTENNDIDQIYSTARITYRNLLQAPFNFPMPLLAIDEGFDSKALSLWRIEDLPNF